MKEVIVTMKLIDGHFYKTLRVTSQEDLEKQVKDWEDSFDVLVVSEHAHFDEIKLTIKESEEKMAQITAKIVDGVDGLFKGFADNIKVKLGWNDMRYFDYVVGGITFTLESAAATSIEIFVEADAKTINEGATNILENFRYWFNEIPRI